jgi:hypothetical protein
MWMEKAAAVALRLDPKSLRKASKKTEKACRGPMEIAHARDITPAMIHP